MLACIHHVSWVAPAPEGKHRCQYCRALVTRRDIYPKFDELGPDFQQRWEAHEATGPAPEKPAVKLPVADPPA